MRNSAERRALARVNRGAIMPHTCAGATVLPPVHVRLRVAVGPWRVGTVEWTPCFVSLRVSYAFEHELRCAALKLYRNYMDKAKGAAHL